MIVKTLKEGNLEAISLLWEQWLRITLEVDDFEDLFELGDLNLIETLLKAIHYHFKKKVFDEGITFLPSEVIDKFQTKIKIQLEKVIIKNDMTTFVPLFGYGLLSLFDNEEIFSFILNPSVNLLKKVLSSFIHHRKELYFYHNIAIELEEEIFIIAKQMDILNLKKVIFNIIKDKDRIDYSHLIRDGFIENLNHEELLEVLNNQEIFKNFINSLSNAFFEVKYFDIPFYFLKFGKKLVDSLRISLINILRNSKPKRAEDFYSYTLNTKFWDLPLTLRSLGWYKSFTIEQLKEILNIIKEKYSQFKENDYNKKFPSVIKHLENLIEKPNIKELIQLVEQASEGKDNVEKGAVGSNGYGFVFKDTDCNIAYIQGFWSSKFAAAGSYRNFLKDWKKQSKYGEIVNILDQMRENKKKDLLLAGSLKTLVPSLRFGGDENLFSIWMFVKTPDNKYFSATFYYGASGTSVGGWNLSDTLFTDLLTKDEKELGDKIFPQELESIINFDPFNFNNEDLNLFLDAIEFALKKVPVSDFEGVYKHDLGESYMGVRKGKPFNY